MKRLVLFSLLTALFFAVLFVFIPKEPVKQIKTPVAASKLALPRISDRILYVSDKNGTKDIYELDLETKKITRLTDGPGDEMNPQVSPDRSRIVYYANPDGDNEIYEMQLTTKKTVKLTDNTSEDYDPTYTPDGKSIVFKSDRDDKKGDIFLMLADGTRQRNITGKRNGTEEWDPVMNNTGDIFFVVRQDNNHLTDELYLMSGEAGEERQLTDNTYADWYPAVSETGELVYISKEKPGSEDDLFLLSMTTLKRTQLTTEAGNDSDPAWSRDGKRIVYINDEDGDYDIYLINADGTGRTLILSTDDEELSPVFL